MRQLKMGFLKNYKKEFGGKLLEGKRKAKRPLSMKHPLHLVLRSELKGVFNPTNQGLQNLIRKTAQGFGIKVYDLALNWNHIHCVIRVRRREDYVRFIRVLTARLAMKIRKHKKAEVIFTLRPFTRILSWGRDLKKALNYQVLNQLEALGFISRRKRARASTKRPVINESRHRTQNSFQYRTRIHKL